MPVRALSSWKVVPLTSANRSNADASRNENESVPSRTAAGYRLYGLRELNQLRALAELRSRFEIGIGDIAFAARLRREPELRAAIDGWLAGAEDRLGWVEWEQRKHERLLAA